MRQLLALILIVVLGGAGITLAWIWSATGFRSKKRSDEPALSSPRAL